MLTVEQARKIPQDILKANWITEDQYVVYSYDCTLIEEIFSPELTKSLAGNRTGFFRFEYGHEGNIIIKERLEDQAWT